MDFLDFESFLREKYIESSGFSKERESAIYYLNGLTRSYKTATSQLKSTDFENLGEKSRLMNLRIHMDDFETHTVDGEREITFTLNDEEVFMKFDFDVEYSAQGENDNPDADSSFSDNLYCKLEDIIIKRFEIVSPNVTKIYTKFRPDLLKSIKECLIKLLEPYYDILGQKLDTYSLEQK